MQIEPLIKGINQQKLYKVDMCWLEIHGPNSEVWLDYLYDHSFPVVSWWMADGVSTEWFPHPAPLPNQEPTMIAPPEKTYPVDTLEPTMFVPYPWVFLFTPGNSCWESRRIGIYVAWVGVKGYLIMPALRKSTHHSKESTGKQIKSICLSYWWVGYCWMSIH